MLLHELVEHETAPRPTPIGKDEVCRHLEQAEQLKLTIGAADSPVLSLFRDRLDGDHHVIVLTTRTNQKTPVGYIILARAHSTERWQVIDVELDKDLRGQGIITNLYRGLTAAGYKLQSGDILSPAAERVWQSLGKAGVAHTFDRSTGEVLPFDLQPIGDGDLVSGTPPRFYWITEGQALATTYYRGGQLSEQQARDWLAGVPVDRNHSHLLGVNTFAVDADI